MAREVLHSPALFGEMWKSAYSTLSDEDRIAADGDLTAYGTTFIVTDKEGKSRRLPPSEVAAK